MGAEQLDQGCQSPEHAEHVVDEEAIQAPDKEQWLEDDEVLALAVAQGPLVMAMVLQQGKGER